MDRLKTARGAGGVGGRIEGMGRVAGSSGGSWFARLFGVSRARSEENEGEGEGDGDEGLIWGGKGPFRWEDVEGVEVEWGVSGLGMVSTGKPAVGDGDGEQGDGLSELEAFLRGL